MGANIAAFVAGLVIAWIIAMALVVAVAWEEGK
jgi:hypothetical protein